MALNFSIMDNVTLELRPEHPTPTEAQPGDPSTSGSVIRALTLTREQWAALSDNIGDGSVDISAPRNV